METKKCSKCGLIKNIPDDFIKDKRRSRGCGARCKVCDKKYPRKQYMSKFKENHPEYFKNYAKNHPNQSEASKQKEKEYEKKYRRIYLMKKRNEDPEYRRWKAEKDKLYRHTPQGIIRAAKARFNRRRRENNFSLSKEDWSKILLAFNNQCAYCGDMNNLTMDHFIPLARGGETHKNNIVPACLTCNSKKQHKMPSEWCTASKFTSVIDILATI